MTDLKNNERFHLMPWTEIIGKLHGISRDDNYLFLEIDHKVIPFRRDSMEALYIQEKIEVFMGKSIALLRTDIPDKPFLVRLVSKRGRNEESNF